MDISTSRSNIMEEETTLTFFPNESDLDHSFTSTTSAASSSTTFGTSSARSSLSLPSFHFPPSIKPLPHSSSHPNWSAIRAASALSPDSSLHLRNLSLVRHLGSGNLARVYHCRLRGLDDASGPDFALKVIDLDKLSPSSDLLSHVRTEARVLSSLDHPFLPTLYARLDAGHYACFLIDYCPAGDLHSLLHRRPNRRLPLPSAAFYAAEVLLALQYLHALGFVYRDLKPENVLIRADGHVMLSDFDLCFQSHVQPSLLPIPNPDPNPNPKSSSCNCFPRPAPEQAEMLEFVAEPNTAYSRACVGTHEYLAPEVVAGAGHGNGVDWWAFGVFIYELLYGRTPFKGATKEATLRNIAAGKEVRFPDIGVGGRKEEPARDLIARLLVRDPKRRLGATLGAAEIMRHPFFDGVKWPLIRCSAPPAVAGGGGGAERRRWVGRWERSRGILGRIGSKLGLGSKVRVKGRKSRV